MKKVTVQMEIEIPSGYNLAEPNLRKAMVGEYYLDIRRGEVCVNSTRCETVTNHPILHKALQPEVGKWYMFSDDLKKLGTSKGSLLKFTGMVDGRYIDSCGIKWGYCWPVPDTVIIGK